MPSRDVLLALPQPELVLGLCGPASTGLRNRLRRQRVALPRAVAVGAFIAQPVAEAALVRLPELDRDRVRCRAYHDSSVMERDALFQPAKGVEISGKPFVGEVGCWAVVAERQVTVLQHGQMVGRR